MLLMVTTRQTAPVCVKLQLQDSYHLLESWRSSRKGRSLKNRSSEAAVGQQLCLYIELRWRGSLSQQRQPPEY